MPNNPDETTENNRQKRRKAPPSPIKKEIARLNRVYKDLPDNQKSLAQGLIVQAARLRAQLDDLSADIAVHGLTELFTQSPSVPPYTRTRPQAELFAKLDKNYQAIIRQLNELLPPDAPAEDSDLAKYRANS